VLLGDLEVGSYEAHSRDSTETYDNAGLDETNLLSEIINASILFGGKGIAIFGRSALEDVGYVDVLTVDVNGVKKFVKKLSCSANKGRAAQILLLARSLSHEQDLRIFIAYSENTVGSRFVQGTFRAGSATVI
jgi:hypothetical protein